VAPTLSGRARLRWGLGAAALYLALALMQLYPAWLAPENGVVGDWMHPDMISNHWLYRWLPEQVLSGGSILHNDRYYLPVGDGPWLAGNGSDALPFTFLAHWLGWPGSVTFWSIGIVVANGLAGYTLARVGGAKPAGAIVGGAVLAAFPYVAYELSCARLAQAPLYWFALFLASWIRLLEDPKVWRGVLAGALYGACAFTYWYYGLWAAGAGALLFAFRREWRALLSFVPTALVFTLPPLLLFLQNWSGIPGAAGEGFPHQLAMDSGLPLTFPLLNSGPLKAVTLSFTGLFLAGWSLRGERRWWSFGLAAAAAGFYLMSLGPEIKLPGGEETGIPGPYLLVYGLSGTLRRFWWPYRHIAPMAICLVPLAALGAEALLRGLEGWRTPALVGLVALIPIELQTRGAPASVTTSWWEAPEAYEALAELPGGALLELPIYGPLARTQQSLSYQWVHGRALVNGHAMWVDRVRPTAWDEWVDAQALLSGLRDFEAGERAGEWSVSAAELAALRAEGVGYISLNPEFFPGELADLEAHYAALLEALLGPPVAEADEVRFWAIGGDGGSVSLPVWSPPASYLAKDGTTMPTPSTINARGWRPLPRTIPPQLPPEQSHMDPNDEDAVRARERQLSPMLRRKRERDRAREAEK